MAFGVGGDAGAGVVVAAIVNAHHLTPHFALMIVSAAADDRGSGEPNGMRFTVERQDLVALLYEVARVDPVCDRQKSSVQMVKLCSICFVIIWS